MLSPRAIAVEGVGFGHRLMALSGLWGVIAQAVIGHRRRRGRKTLYARRRRLEQLIVKEREQLVEERNRLVVPAPPPFVEDKTIAPALKKLRQTEAQLTEVLAEIARMEDEDDIESLFLLGSL
jgi:transposase